MSGLSVPREYNHRGQKCLGDHGSKEEEAVLQDQPAKEGQEIEVLHEQKPGPLP